MAFPADIGTGSAILDEPFTASNGNINSVLSDRWGNPFWGQSPSGIASNQLRPGPSSGSTWCDCYTLANGYGDGDYIIDLVVQPAVNTQLFMWICANLTGPAGYNLSLGKQSTTDRIRFYRMTGGAYNALFDTNVEFADNDQWCIRKDGSSLYVARKASGGSWTQVGSTVVDANYSSGRVAFEHNNPTCRVDNLKIFALPSSDVTPPTVNVIAGGNAKISSVTGKDSVDYTFQVNEACQAWKVKIVPSSASVHTAGTQIEAGGAIASGGTVNVNITFAEMTAAGGSGGNTYVVKFFAQDTAGNWSS